MTQPLNPADRPTIKAIAQKTSAKTTTDTGESKSAKILNSLSTTNKAIPSSSKLGFSRYGAGQNNTKSAASQAKAKGQASSDKAFKSMIEKAVPKMAKQLGEIAGSLIKSKQENKASDTKPEGQKNNAPKNDAPKNDDVDFA